MLSNRGETYVKAGLADGYLRPRKPFNRDTKEGVVSFGNAENVSQSYELLLCLYLTYVRPRGRLSTDKVPVPHARHTA
jgi:hypothetical protein